MKMQAMLNTHATNRANGLLALRQPQAVVADSHISPFNF
jgi:hypothetical protein